VPLETIVFRTALPAYNSATLRGTPVGDRGLYQYRRVQGTFRHDWDMSRYPFDRHRLMIPFDESDLGAGLVIFEAHVDASSLEPELPSRLHGWEISALDVRASVADGREAKREQLGQYRDAGLGDAVFGAIELGELCVYRGDRYDRARRPAPDRMECQLPDCARAGHGGGGAGRAGARRRPRAGPARRPRRGQPARRRLLCSPTSATCPDELRRRNGLRQVFVGISGGWDRGNGAERPLNG
jgi:hypothetical protein